MGAREGIVRTVSKCHFIKGNMEIHVQDMYQKDERLYLKSTHLLNDRNHVIPFPTGGEAHINWLQLSGHKQPRRKYL